MLHVLSFHMIPLAIGLLSLAALTAWDSYYGTTGEQALSFRVWRQGEASIAPEEAKARLANEPNIVNHYDTQLSELPVWFSFAAPHTGNATTMAEFPSRHASEVACWNAETLAILGRATRSHAEAALSQVKAGFALKLGAADSQVLCRALFVGPARLTATLWPAEQLQVSIQQYHRKSGLLDGGLIVLAVFFLMTALINRQSLYMLFAAWLFLNVRVGALSAGWDIQWLGQTVPADWILVTRTVTIALYALLTVALFKALFREDLAKTPYQMPLNITQWLCVPLLVSSVVLPFRQFLPVMWVFIGLGLVLMSVSLVSIVSKARMRVALWYAASFAVTFISSFFELAAAALDRKELIGMVNSTTAALASSLLAAMALAEQMRQEHSDRLRAQAELQHTYEAMPVGLFTVDGNGQFVSANPALHHMLGANVLETGRTAWRRYFGDGAWTQLHNLVHTQNDGELELRSRDDSKCFLVKATLAHGKIEGFLQDVTDKSKATEDLRFMANNDPLTKVLNRRGIEKSFEDGQLLAAKGKPLALAYLDLDRFKLINDLFGHPAGDEVLKQVCQRITNILGAGQHVGRMGGDEFVIVMSDTAIPLASLICRGIVDSICGTPYRVGDKAFHVRGSIGLVGVSADMQIKDAVSAADRACREAKAGNSDGLVVYEKHAAAIHERAAELDLVERLSGNAATTDLFVEMQPIMSLRTPYESLNFEVLLRMRDRDGSTIPAGRIIAAAEKSGRTSMIDRWVLSTVLAWVDANYTRLPRTQFVCMNLSGASLNDERFVQDTLEMLEQNCRAAARLCIEITESVALHDLDNTRRFIHQVRSYGVKIGLDDFGAGYTSFSYLKELPADVLKIDGNFIVNINDHPANVAIVAAMVNLAANLGMRTIAEWAEDTATVRTLAEIGVDYVQGYAVARSQSPARLLTATSAASFIEDEELLQLVRMLGSPDDVPSDASNVIRFQDLH